MIPHHRSVIAALAACLTLASACGDDEQPKRAVDQKPDPGPGPGPGPEPTEPPTWDESAFALRWSLPGFGGGLAGPAAADLDGDGDDELIFVGRGVAAIDPEGPRLLWHAKFTEMGFTAEQGLGSAVRVIPSATGNEAPDVLVSHYDGQVILLDGATGATVWTRGDLGLDFLLTDIALVDADDDGIRDVFPTHGNRAISGATGEDLWTVDLWQGATHLAEANLDGDDRGDLLIGLEPPAPIGGWSTAAEGEETQLFGVAGDGTVLFRFTPEGRTLEVAAADLDGDGIDEALLTTDMAELFAVDATGTQLWRLPVTTPDGVVWTVQGFDTDGDGADELYLAGGDFTNGWFVARVDPDGTKAWLHPVTNRPYAFVFDGTLLVAATGGEDQSLGLGELIALAPATGEEAWSVDSERSMRGAALLRRGDRTEVAVGEVGAVARSYDTSDGSVSLEMATGDFVTRVAAADLDGDGIDEVIRGDIAGWVTVLDHAGARMRDWRPDMGPSGFVTGLAVADLDGDGTPELAVSGDRGFEFDGIVAVMNADGSERWAIRLENPPYNVLAADLDGDGKDELVFGERIGGVACAVRAIDGNGDLLWERDVSDSCMEPILAVGDVDADGIPEIGYGDVGGANVALLAADGSEIWNVQAAYDTRWLLLGAGGFVHGGIAESAGHVTLRDPANGDEVAQHTIEPARSDTEGSPHNGWTLFAAIVPDTNDDGVDEIAASSVNGSVVLLDGATLDALWTTRLQPEGLAVRDARHAGPVAFVPETDETPAYVAVAQSTFVPTDGALFALDLDGAIVGEQAMLGEGRAIAVTQHGERFGVAVGAGLGVYAAEAVQAE